MPDKDTPRLKFPKYINAYYDRHGKYRTYYRRSGYQLRIDGEPLSDEWWDAYEEIHSRAGKPRRAPSSSVAMCENLLMASLGNIRVRAKKKGILFSLSKTDIVDLSVRANGKCELSGLPFEYEGVRHRARPFIPSIDRIEPDKGYVASNCRVVSFAVNFALAEWGYDQLLKIASALIDKSLEARPIKIKM